MKPLRVLVVDDSVMNRRTITGLLESEPDVEVVGGAADGDEALRMVAAEKPDLITLDLEMPRMDGFTFLRLLMASRPTPVVVVSSHSAKENVFRALEVGAIDFVTKPDQTLTGSVEPIRDQLVRMLGIVRQLSPATVKGRRGPGRPSQLPPVPDAARPEHRFGLRNLVVVGSSTGGPAALIELFSRLPVAASSAIVVAQHMPDRFTKTFAERLDRQSAFDVREPGEVEVLRPAMGLICPGGRCLDIEQRGDELVASVRWPRSEDRYAPSADRLFSTAANAMGDRVVCAVLTGMGRDGAKGLGEVHRVGGQVFAESEQTAVVYGMPKAAKHTGQVDEVLPLDKLIDRIVELVQ